MENYHPEKKVGLQYQHIFSALTRRGDLLNVFGGLRGPIMGARKKRIYPENIHYPPQQWIPVGKILLPKSERQKPLDELDGG